MIDLEALPDKEIVEDGAQVGILGCPVILEGADVVEIGGEFPRKILAEFLDADSHLLL